MAKEIERVGIPTALFTPLVPLALMVGANRIVPGKAVTHPIGDPALPPDEETAYRRQLLERGLRAIRSPITEQTVF